MPRYDVPAARTAVQLIALLAGSPEPLGVSAIARALTTNKNMAFRLLTTLQEEGWVSASEPGPRYGLTLVPFRIASGPVSRLSVKEAAREPLRALWGELGESTYLGILHDEGVLYIEHHDSVRPVRVAGMVGGHYPLHCTAPGKVLLAHAEPEVLAAVKEKGLARQTEKTITTATRLEKHLAEIRRQGYATDNEEFGRGILCFAAPVFDHRGAAVGTVGISVSTVSHTLAGLVKKAGVRIQDCARDISRRLGAP